MIPQYEIDYKNAMNKFYIKNIKKQQEQYKQAFYGEEQDIFKRLAEIHKQILEEIKEEQQIKQKYQEEKMLAEQFNKAIEKEIPQIVEKSLAEVFKGFNTNINIKI